MRRFRTQEIQTVEAEIRAAISPNGLALNDETLRDGNCGLDAIIRTIAEVPRETRPAVAAELMHVLEQHGRLAALKWLRARLVAWLKANPETEILDGMSIETFVLTDDTPHFSFDSFKSYLTTMGTHGEWVDHVMLYAAASVLDVHVLIFSGGSEPQVISASEEVRPNATNCTRTPAAFLGTDPCKQ